MWITTTFGFFSVVAHRDDANTLCVRARARADLIKLIAAIGQPHPPIVHTPDADYPYRILVKRATLAVVIAETIGAINYPNFKTACAQNHATEHDIVTREKRNGALHDVWYAMHGFEDRDARNRPRPPIFKPPSRNRGS